MVLEIESHTAPFSEQLSANSSDSKNVHPSLTQQDNKPVLFAEKLPNSPNKINRPHFSQFENYKIAVPTDSTIVKKKIKRKKFWQRDDWELIRFIIFLLLLIVLFLALVYLLFGPVGILVVLLIVLACIAIFLLLLLVALLVIKWIAQFGI